MSQNLKMDSSVQQSEPTIESIQSNPHLLNEQQLIREFSPDNADKEPVYEKTTHYSNGDLDTFAANDVTYNVNRNTGRIQSLYANEIGKSSGNNIISIDQGSLIAEIYAKEKCPEFWVNEKEKVIKKTSQNAKDNEFAYSWRQYFVLRNNASTDSQEIAGFNLIDVTLDAREGKVKSYHEWFIPNDANLNLNPNLSQDQSWELVKKYFVDTGIGTIDVTQDGQIVRHIKFG